MLKLLSNFFRSFQTQQAPREIQSPKELQAGDMFKFADSFSLPESLRDETFQVQKVATYFYTDTPNYEYVIKSGPNKPLFLSIEDFDGDELLVISRKLKRKEVSELMGSDAIKQALADRDAEFQCSSQDDWFASNYSCKVHGAEAAYFDRAIAMGSSQPGGGEQCRYYEYYSSDEKHSFEIEVWDGNEQEFCAGIVRPFTDIVEYWPKKS